MKPEGVTGDPTAHPTRVPQAPGAPHSPHPAPEVGPDLEASAGTTAMRAQDVPDELVSLGSTALALHYRSQPRHKIPTLGGQVKAILAAVLPIRDAQIEREVRAKVAEEIEAGVEREAPIGDWDPYGEVIEQVLRFVRGGA